MNTALIISFLHTPKAWANRAVIIALGVMILCITGCQSTNPKPNNGPSVEVPSSLVAEQLLSDASLLQGSAQQTQYLKAAEMFLNLGDAQRAVIICQTLNPQSLGDALYAKQREIQSRAFIKLGNLYAAKGQLEAPRLETLLNLYERDANNTIINLSQIAFLRAMRADLYYGINESTLAISERIRLGSVLNDLPVNLSNTLPSDTILQKNQNALNSSLDTHVKGAQLENDSIQINQELIWMMLMEQDIQQLQARLAHLNTQAISLGEPSQIAVLNEQGWYQLAILSKDNQRNIKQQYNALVNWQQQWPSHAANTPLPADLALIEYLINNQPRQIALMLPLTGKLKPLAEAVRDGFMAAYFANAQAGGHTPEINIYDVGQGDINEHYDFAVNQGAEVIIGPLSKDKISELALRPELPIPTLALNQIEPSEMFPPQLFQLGLGVEDEASEAAQKAFKEGKRHALIIAPAGNQGDRATQVFSQQWQALGGVISDGVRYSNEAELSTIIEQAMHLNASKTRARDLRAIVGNFEFEPRRRQDLDMVFLVAQPREGRQIKPLLAFHYAGDLPIYSTSSIYEGSNQLENDLNGIMFSHLPWFFQESPEKTSVLKNATLNARSQRLYALGVDAYYLFPRLKQLGSANQANFWGQTGVLSLNAYNQFLRKQQWAHFKRGKAQALTNTNL